jgi:hypothetical protein
VIDKRKQVLQCPYCDRTFQQKERFNAHISSKHSAEHAEAQEADQEEQDTPQSSSTMMQVNSKAGYYTKKSPHLFLLEQSRSEKRIKPRIKVLVRFPTCSRLTMNNLPTAALLL